MGGIYPWEVSFQGGGGLWEVSVHGGGGYLCPWGSLSRGVSFNERAVRILLECIIVYYIYIGVKAKARFFFELLNVNIKLDYI